MKLNTSKKKVMSLSILSLILICVFISYNYSAGNIQANNQKPTRINSESLSVKEIKSIDEVIERSSNIVVGKVVRIEDYSKCTDQYIVNIEKNVKGSTNTENIDVYETKGTLEVGGQYVLFLESHESVLYPRTSYTSACKECIIKVENNNLVGNSKFIAKSLDVNDLVKNIEKSDKFSVKVNRQYNIKDKYETLDEQIEASDSIAVITASNIIKTNKYVCLVKLNPDEEFKGSITSENTMLLPGDIQEGKKYIVFLKKDKYGILKISSREGSIISEDEINKYNELKEKLKMQ